MTITQPLLADPNYVPDPAGLERLTTIVALLRLRTHLERQGWMKNAIWPEQDAPYPGQGPVCLTGGVAVCTGNGHLSEGHDLRVAVDHHAVTAALDETLSTLNPRDSLGTTARQQAWDWADGPGDRLAIWNDARGRTKREVIALIDATVERLES